MPDSGLKKCDSRLTQVTDPTGTYQFTYDNNGNTLTKVVGSNTTTYAWDFENRLTSVTLPGSGGTVSFKYDPFGRRIYKSSSSGTSVFAYDGDNLVEETNASGTAVARYSDGLNIDEPLAMLRSGATSFYHADGLGSVTSLSNTSGAIAQTYAFDSFGNQTGSSGSLTNSFRYTAREFDAETSLYYYRARYYDAGAGRFASEDALRFDTGGTNFYAYVRNRPVDLLDPLGLWPGSIVVTRVNQTIQLARDVGAFWGQFAWGAFDMWNNYERMEERNWKKDDKYYHCMGNCQATNRGLGGGFAAAVISFGRTHVYSRVFEPSDWRNDEKANKCGQRGGDCSKICGQYIPKSSPGNPRFPGW